MHKMQQEKSHYKKLLRYISVMDYVFNEAKFETIQYSLELLDKKFRRLYECYLNNGLFLLSL